MTTTGSAPNSPTQASLYQQLRAHLATLKLHDAAEHLPAVLDAATAKGLSLTAALERLLALEVDAAEARRLTGRLRFTSLPTTATLTEFTYDAAPGLDPQLINELATGRYLQTATNLLLIGPPGVGKTHLAVGLARSAAEAGTTPTSPPPPTSPLAATGPRSKAAGLPPAARRGRFRPVPGRVPAVPEDLDHPEQQPRRRLLG